MWVIFRNSVLLAIVAVLCTACSSQRKEKDSVDELTGSEVAAKIESDIKEKSGEIYDVTCPPIMEGNIGDSDTCTAVLKGGDTVIKVRITHQGGGEVNWRLIEYIDPEKVESVIEDGFRTRAGFNVTADCPRVPVKKGTKFRCIAQNADGKIAVQVTQTDDAGHIEWKSEKIVPT
jgi:hypothetical protein